MSFRPDDFHPDIDLLLSYMGVKSVISFGSVDKKRYEIVFKKNFNKLIFPIYWESARFSLNTYDEKKYFTSGKIRRSLLLYSFERGEEWALDCYSNESTFKYNSKLISEKIKQLYSLLDNLPYKPPRKRARYSFIN